jgi:Flp pilus assembly protein CpaB
MSRRGRAAVFGLLALAAAGLAAAIADSYGSRVVRSFGPLRPVVVARAPLPAGRQIGPGALASMLDLRRVPARFIPPGTLSRPEGALGLVPRAEVPAGAYLMASILRPPRPRRARGPGLPAGRRPVAIAVSAPAGLPATAARGGSRVDVVVTTEPTGAGPGRTYIAAARVPLLGLELAGQGIGPGATATATLGLTRRQALELIGAQTFARQVTLLASPPP